MIDPLYFLDCLKRNNLNFATGVPDSLLKDLLKALEVTWNGDSHLIAANEGNAVALASGHYISTGNPAIVYMQNSGLGNAINPLTSLADSEVYGIPMLMIVGWRGEPGVDDEPQHIKKGRITEELLNVLEIPVFKLNAYSDVDEIIANASLKMISDSKPVVILVSKESFSTFAPEGKEIQALTLTREQAIEIVVELVPQNAVIVCTTGMASRELFEIRKGRKDSHEKDFLTVGSMGHASSIAMSIATNYPKRKVICLDGDGSLLMHLGANAILGQSKLPNFFHVLLNNGAHDSVGGQPTIGFRLDFSEVANSFGYYNSNSASTEETVKKMLISQLEAEGPNFLEIRVKKGSRRDLGRPNRSPKENLKDFMENLQSE